MPKTLSPFLTRTASLAASGLVVGTALILTAAAPAGAQDAASRAAMEQCTQRVLRGLAQSKAPESEAGPAVVAQCDKQLRAALASAIEKGDAANCKVDTCMDMARQRASQEATMAYRQAMR